MQRKLEDIVLIRSGVHFRGRIEYKIDGNVSVIQLKDVNEQGIINYDKLQRVKLDRVKDVDRLIKGDILLKAKSKIFTAAFIDRDIPDTVATVQYFILKLKDSTVLPEYLAWFLNQKKARQYFDQVAEGSSFRSFNILKKKFLEDFMVDVPSIEKQKKIVEIYALYLKEKNLEEEIRIKKDIYMEEMLLKSVEK